MQYKHESLLSGMRYQNALNISVPREAKCSEIYNLTKKFIILINHLILLSQTKRMKMSLQKAVSITINSISAQSGSALKKKVGLLQDLLSGRSVSVGNDSVSTNGIPEAVMFCKNLTAKKLVVSEKINC